MCPSTVSVADLPATHSIGSVLLTRKTDGRISQGCAAVHSVVNGQLTGVCGAARLVWCNQWRLVTKGVEYNRACYCQYHCCSETCIREAVVLSDSIGVSERVEGGKGKQ